MEQGRSPQEVLSYILGSSEYFDHLGNQRDPYLTEIHRTVVGKEPTPADLAELQQLLHNYQGSRARVVRGLLRNQPDPPY